MKEEQTKNTLLVIEDSPAQLTIYSRALESLDVEILKAKNGEEAISIINSEDLTLVICDLYLPDMTAYEILAYTYEKKGLKSLPFVIMTGKYTEEDLKKLLDLGANDFLRKPFSVVEFLARIKTQLRLKNAFNEEKRLNEMLTILNSKLEEMAIRDELTGLYNRRFLFEFIEKQIQKCKRYKNTFCLLIFDIDDFKNINDTHGHLVGDEAIKHAVSLISKNIRESDILGRFGGEEFLAVLLEANVSGASIVSEKLRKFIEETPLVFKNKKIKFTVSIGLTEFSAGADIDALIERADFALYKAKNNGKNKVEIN